MGAAAFSLNPAGRSRATSKITDFPGRTCCDATLIFDAFGSDVCAGVGTAGGFSPSNCSVLTFPVLKSATRIR